MSACDLPDDAPQLPAGSAYRGRLGDFAEKRLGHIWYPGREEGWSHLDAWHGVKNGGCPGHEQEGWHFAEALAPAAETAQPTPGEGATPRTDKAAGFVGQDGVFYQSDQCKWHVAVDFARNLERELTAAEAERDRLKATLQHIEEAKADSPERLVEKIKTLAHRALTEKGATP